MRSFFRALAAVLAISLGLTGCGYSLAELDGQSLLGVAFSSKDPENTSSAPTEEGEDTPFYLPIVESDPLNPYTLETAINLSLSGLIYDTLFVVEEDFSVTPSAAVKAEEKGTLWTVTLKEGLRFSDGSEMTLADVNYSLKTAMSSGNFSSRYRNIRKTEVKDNTLRITLRNADHYFDRLLDFPIIKNKSAKENIPVGSGMYSVKVKQVTELHKTYYLEVNENHPSAEVLPLQQIQLVASQDEETIIDSVRLGDISFFSTDAGNLAISNITAVSTRSTLNHMVYLGLNLKNELFASAEFRRALNLILDRDEILTRVYGEGEASHLPVHPAFLEQIGYTPAQPTGEIETLLARAGLIQKNKDGIYLWQDRPLELTILVNQDNPDRVTAARMIARQLTSAGIGAKILELPFSQYRDKINWRQYDLYLGEMKMSTSPNLSAFLEQGGAAYCDYEGASILLSAFQGFSAGTLSAETLDARFSGDCPFLPVLFRSGLVAYSRKIRTFPGGSLTSPYSKFCQWELA
ncbi:MAG: ABC transporter substrate-binding protein [Oscillospiraceae bacterium]|nr:ABC transporter substrate-binding protein [Oscillospiraceae bacterium]